MVQTYQGYFEEGRFVSTHTSSIPDYVEVYVVVTGKTASTEITKAQKQRQAFEEFIQTVANAEPLSKEFDQIISQGINIRGELDNTSDFERIDELKLVNWKHR